MSHHMLEVATAVPLDTLQARTGLERLLADGPHELSMRLPLRDFGFPADLSLETEIVIATRLERDSLNLNEDLHVMFWAASAPQIFPTFSGVLDVFPDPNGSIFQLRGTYEAPFGEPGRLFDTAIGHLIAQRSAKVLLEELGERVRGAEVKTP